MERKLSGDDFLFIYFIDKNVNVHMGFFKLPFLFIYLFFYKIEFLL